MEILSFLIGLVLGIISLSMKRILLLIKTTLSVGTSYLLILIANPSFKLWKLEDLKWEHIWTDYNYKTESIIFFLISFLMFYVFFPFILNHSFGKMFKTKYNSFFMKINNYGERKLKLFAHKLIRIGLFISIRLGRKYSKKQKNGQIIDDWNDLIQMTSLIIHFLICWIFILGFPSITISLIMTFILFFLIFGIILFPFSKNMYLYIDNVFDHELNRYFKSIS